MTPHEKAVNAINARLERLQANLRDAKSETAQQFLFQSIIVTIGMNEAMTGYIQMVGQHAQRRHATFKDTSAAAGARHAELLNSGKELLEQLKVTPADRAIRKEIERAQRNMAGIQKALRRDAFAVQRELGLTMATIDKLAVSVRRLCEADQSEVLRRVLTMMVGHARELYAALGETLPAKDIIDAAAWESSAVATIDQATDFHDAYARAGYQAMLAVDVMTMAVSETPPQNAEEATRRAAETAAVRLKDITARFTAT